MSTGLGQTFRSSILNYIFRGATSPALSTVFISLHTGDPGDDGQAGNETSGTNYARVSVSTAGGTNFNATTSANPSVLTNATAIAFSTAGSGGWSGGTTPLTHWGAWNSSTLTGTANYIGRGSIGSQLVVAGNTPTFAIGQLSMTINIVNSTVDTGMSQAFRAALYDAIFRAGTDPLPNGTYTSLFLSLHTADPGNTGTSEAPATGGYTRATFARVTSPAFTVAVNGNPCTAQNGNTAVSFPQATTPGYSSGTGAMIFWGLWRVVSSGTGADYIMRGQMTSQVVVTNNVPSFGITSGGQLITRLDQT